MTLRVPVDSLTYRQIEVAQYVHNPSTMERSMTADPVLRFTPQQRRIADGIGRELSYAEIGVELGISEHTVRAHVKQMALIAVEPHELPPRWRILFCLRVRQWEDGHAQQLPKPA